MAVNNVPAELVYALKNRNPGLRVMSVTNSNKIKQITRDASFVAWAAFALYNPLSIEALPFN